MAVAAARELRVVNPATLEEVGTVAALDPSEVPALAAEAAVAQERWAATPPAERVAVLRRLRQAVLRRAPETAACVRAETGKPLVEAYTSELYPALDALAWLERQAPRVLGTERVRMSQPHLLHKRAWLRYESLGVVGFCMGGAFALQLAVQEGSKVAGAVAFYPTGYMPDDYAGLKAPVLIHIGDRDEINPPTQAEDLNEKISAGAGRKPEIVHYPAGHAFLNEEDLLGTYDAEQAKIGWGRTISFLRAHLE